MKISDIQVEVVDLMGTDLSVVNAARVSFDKESNWEVCQIDGASDLSEKDKKLIQYLAKHDHWSPFSHTSISFRIKAPIFVARQMAKHVVGASWNEVSRRYVDSEPEFYFPKVWRGRPVNAKQGSSGVVETEAFGNFCDLPVFPKEFCAIALDLYTDMIKKDIAPEQARMILPQNTMTTWIWTGSLLFFSRVCKLRLDPHSQKETTDVAKLIAAECKQMFPHSWEALVEQGQTKLST